MHKNRTYVLVVGMKIALYCRVSTDEQAQHGFSIGFQQERLVAYAVSQDWQDYELYVDDGYTGTNMDRPALKRLIRHVNAGKIQAVAVYRLDRLGRRQKDILYLLEDLFEKYKVAFKSVTEPFDTSAPLGKAMLGILAVFGQLERDTIVERSVMGQTQRRKRGLWSGRTPFGYEWDDKEKRMLVVPSEAALVKEVYRRYLKGEPRSHIAEWLQKQTNVRYIDHSFIYDMILRPTYAGFVREGENLVDGKHESIIDLETWEKAKKRLLEKKRSYGKYLLSNILYCGVCGGTMKHTIMSSVNRQKRKYTYDFYICSQKWKHGKEAYPDCRSHRQQAIDTRVIESVRTLALSPESISGLANEYQKEDTRDAQQIDLQEKLSEITERINRLLSAIESGFPVDMVMERVKVLREERQNIERRIDELEETNQARDVDGFRSMMQAIGLNWGYMTFEEQCSILKAVIRKVTVYLDKSIEIEWNI